MSGIVGVVNLNGESIPPEQLTQLTASLSKWAPDNLETWAAENVGFGHAALLTTPGPLQKQLCTLDGRLSITCDARIDNRNELFRKLKTKSTSDAELILRCYQAWGEACVEHFIGDFVFAIWDSYQQHLFCARDQLGVKQFYYSYDAAHFVFSNSLKTVRLHPSVSNTLNEVAIGDFLLFGLNQDPTSTTFTGITRLPAAHSLCVSQSGLRLKTFWRPKAETIQYKKSSDYVENFRELLLQAVADRIQTKSASISMSGGLDSSSIAAVASLLGNKNGCSLDLRAYCVVYDRAFADEERKFAQLLAEALNIPIEFLEGDLINQGDSQRTLGNAPEPFNVDPIYVVSDTLLAAMSEHSRVALTGWEGDAFMTETPRHFFWQSLKKGQFRKLASGLGQYMSVERKPPPIGLRTALTHLRNPRGQWAPFPEWLNKDFAQKHCLVERWREINLRMPDKNTTRPRAFETIASPNWSALMNRFDSAVTQLSLEVRHPLIDLRVVEYLLALPVVPWLLDKRILREAMTDFLPESIRLRAKSPLTCDPGLQLSYSKKFRAIDSFQSLPALNEYISRSAIPSVADENDRNQLWMNLRPFCLNQWLLRSFPLETTE